MGKGNLFPLKSPSFRFWHWGSSNIFHPSLCFSCCASKIETKPKGRTKPMLPLASGRDQGREESECVCVCEWEGVEGEALWRAAQGCRMHVQRELASANSACENSLYLSCCYQFQQKSSIGCCWHPAISKETKSRGLLGNTLIADSCKHMLYFRVTLSMIKCFLWRSAGKICFVLHPLEGAVIMF